MDICPYLQIYLFHTLFEGRDLINTLHFFLDKTFLTFLWLSPLAEEDSAEEEDCSYLQKRRYLFLFVCLFLHFLRCLFLVRKGMSFSNSWNMDFSLKLGEIRVLSQCNSVWHPVSARQFSEQLTSNLLWFEAGFLHLSTLDV